MAPRRRRSPSPGRLEKPERCVVAYRIGFSGNREYIAVRSERWRGEACANSGSTQKGARFEARFAWHARHHQRHPVADDFPSPFGRFYEAPEEEQTARGAYRK